MKVLYCHPLDQQKERDAIAFVDIELNNDVRMYGLRLLRQPDGKHFLYSPQAGHRRTATFSRPLAEELTRLAVEAYQAARDER
ncbi:hypothetical protein GGE45_002719 [Rhizobium aethiopicum]|uniref:hypothetical protein n=1 Tax=Rhizobium aethiopicum TaxID=1138170 RepID=UPI001612CD18|nr:hypothetical protein [Rhizobium aethiopicum]MBB4580389.1 hypothetical protein [Rhizobium aethiopicum]